MREGVEREKKKVKEAISGTVLYITFRVNVCPLEVYTHLITLCKTEAQCSKQLNWNYAAACFIYATVYVSVVKVPMFPVGELCPPSNTRLNGESPVNKICHITDSKKVKYPFISYGKKRIKSYIKTSMRFVQLVHFLILSFEDVH